MLEKTLETSPGREEIKLVNRKGYQPWIFIGKTDAEAEAPISRSTDVNSWLIGKDPDAGKDWGQEEKEAMEDEMAGAITDATDMNLGKLQEMVKDRES